MYYNYNYNSKVEVVFIRNIWDGNTSEILRMFVQGKLTVKNLRNDHEICLLE